jgi:hypothetical protein
MAHKIFQCWPLKIKLFKIHLGLHFNNNWRTRSNPIWIYTFLFSFVQKFPTRDSQIIRTEMILTTIFAIRAQIAHLPILEKLFVPFFQVRPRFSRSAKTISIFPDDNRPTGCIPPLSESHQIV